jgi:glycosyltransferase involved in cell wall biosynthesis
VSNPSVCGILLTADRHDMTARAIQSFLAQDYPNKYLIVWDTGKIKYAPPFVYDHFGIVIYHRTAGPSVGILRNQANAMAEADIIVTWDSDDVSHPARISEQVALLQKCGRRADVVCGYSDLIFWRECHFCHGFTDYCADVALCEYCKGAAGEAFLYRRTSQSQAPGSSLAYWRETWQAKPFPDLPRPDLMRASGEDSDWLRGLNLTVVSSLTPYSDSQYIEPSSQIEPRLIATLHGQNTSAGYTKLDEYLKEGSPCWSREAGFDRYCRRVMET